MANWPYNEPELDAWMEEVRQALIQMPPIQLPAWGEDDDTRV